MSVSWDPPPDLGLPPPLLPLNQPQARPPTRRPVQASWTMRPLMSKKGKATSAATMAAANASPKPSKAATGGDADAKDDRRRRSRGRSRPRTTSTFGGGGGRSPIATTSPRGCIWRGSARG